MFGKKNATIPFFYHFIFKFAGLNTKIMRKIQFEELIEALELFSKQGESYADENGRHGWRNPIRADTGALLRSFVLALQPQRVLEIGTAHGLSALYLSSGWHHTEGVRLDTIEFDAEVAAAAQARMDSVGAPVRVLSGDASVVIPSLHDHYEVVFFDAQKSLYLRHFLQLLEAKCIGPGSLILADNVVDRREECLDFLKYFEESNIPHTVLPTECGLLVARLT